MGCYWLAPAAGPVANPEIMTDLAILKLDLPLKRVCDLTDQDLEFIGHKLLTQAPA